MLVVLELWNAATGLYGAQVVARKGFIQIGQNPNVVGLHPQFLPSLDD